MNASAAALLRRQFWQAHELLEAAVGRFPPAAAGGGAACYAQAVFCEDIGVNCVLAARTPLALSMWAGRTGIDPLPGLGAPIDWPAWARTVRLDLARVRFYAGAVYDATDAYLARLPDPPDATTIRVLTGILLTVSMRGVKSSPRPASSGAAAGLYWWSTWCSLSDFGGADDG